MSMRCCSTSRTLAPARAVRVNAVDPEVAAAREMVDVYTYALEQGGGAILSTAS